MSHWSDRLEELERQYSVLERQYSAQVEECEKLRVHDKKTQEIAARDIQRAQREADQQLEIFKLKLWREIRASFTEAMDESIKVDSLSSINERILLRRLRDILGYLREKGIVPSSVN
jgi:Sec7-like guanine-nucleotide exchange factor